MWPAGRWAVSADRQTLNDSPTFILLSSYSLLSLLPLPWHWPAYPSAPPSLFFCFIMKFITVTDRRVTPSFRDLCRESITGCLGAEKVHPGLSLFAVHLTSVVSPTVVVWLGGGLLHQQHDISSDLVRLQCVSVCTDKYEVLGELFDLKEWGRAKRRWVRPPTLITNGNKVEYF